MSDERKKKYADICTEIRTRTGAKAVLMICLDEHGTAAVAEIPPDSVVIIQIISAMLSLLGKLRDDLPKDDMPPLPPQPPPPTVH